ncbi:hypothetical protein ACIB24_07555 [Spongisporangium articulatum]|uniref:Integral membrane protein n=1 Tax=Spongisporangium articulatum TaxID=3362603 RepID=A0ABW8AKK9_9ACTN
MRTRPSGPLVFDPTTPAGFTEMLLRARADHARELARRGDRGASVVEWVIISALAVGIAVVVGGILLNRLRDKANSIDFDTGGGTGGGGNGGGNGGGTP